MSVIIEAVYVIGCCKKHRYKGYELPKYKNGKVIPDSEIDCVTCGFPKTTEEEEK